MADKQIGPIDLGFTSRNGSTVATPANYASVAAMKTRLAAINGTSYTAARLNSMTINDMVYALRLNDDSGTI